MTKPNTTLPVGEAMKPCLLCGVKLTEIRGTDRWFHEFNGCLLSGKDADARTWNTRPDLRADDGLVEALKTIAGGLFPKPQNIETVDWKAAFNRLQAIAENALGDRLRTATPEPSDAVVEAELAEAFAKQDEREREHAVPLYRSRADGDALEGEVARLRGALMEADISLKAIGHPEPNDPPDAHVCGVIARGALVRIANRLTKSAAPRRNERCEHGIRWPWACHECDEKHFAALSATDKGEGNA